VSYVGVVVAAMAGVPGRAIAVTAAPTTAAAAVRRLQLIVFIGRTFA
jgi:hypothetical protein